VFAATALYRDAVIRRNYRRAQLTRPVAQDGIRDVEIQRGSVRISAVNISGATTMTGSTLPSELSKGGSVSNSSSRGDRKVDKAAAVGDPLHAVQIGRNHLASTGERQRRVAVEGSVAAGFVVVGLELYELSFKITTIPEQHVIEEFSPHRPD